MVAVSVLNVQKEKSQTQVENYIRYDRIFLFYFQLFHIEIAL